MNPVRTKNSDIVYKGPRANIGDLWCHRIRPGLVESVWEPTEAEYELLRNGGRITLTIFREPISPVALHVVPKADSEPVGEHGFKVDVDPGDPLPEAGEQNGKGEEESEEILAAADGAPKPPTQGASDG